MNETINHAAVLFFFLSGVGFWLYLIARFGYAMAQADRVLIWRDGQFQPSEHEADGHVFIRNEWYESRAQEWPARGRE